MISWIKNHFIPHAGNDHRPHLLRSNNTRNILFLIIFLEIFTFLIPTLTYIKRTGGMAAVLPAVLADLTNQERHSEKLQSLTTNPILVKAATMKAEDMASKGYFAHTSPEGKTPWYWLELAGYDYQYAGENLAINFTDSKDVTKAWMDSPTHKANIVKGNYTEMGTGVAFGMYEGKETVFVAQVYANPAKKIVPDQKPEKVETNKPEITNKIAKTPDTKSVLGAETVKTPTNTTVTPSINTAPTSHASFLEKAFASPRNTSNIILFIIFVIISTALTLYVFIKMKNHHYGIITNGLIILALILAILIGNYYLSHRSMLITQSLDYSSENK